jgi:SAM-dependent methyltransferase
MGNHGPIGKIHADVAPIFTKVIDKVAYNGRNIRKEIINSYNPNDTILDLCCGVGISTPENGIGIDTSYEMISKARQLFPQKKFDIANAETYYPNNDIDITSVFFSLHEMPRFARKNLINRAREYTKKELVFVDISTDYIPSPHMLLGEPYILEYLENINEDLREFEKISLIDGHVSMWLLNL